MDNKNSRRGSEWRRWDLHIHAPETKLSNGYGSGDEVWDQYVDFLEDSPVEVFGITDYFSADSYYNFIEKHSAKYPDSNKVAFLNIELRLAEAISKTSDNPNIHIIFDNDEEKCPKIKVNKFLSELKTLRKDDHGLSISCDQLSTEHDFISASVTIEGIESALKNTFGEFKPYLIAFPAKNDGVRSVDSNSPRKVLITDEIDKYSDLFLGDSGSIDYFLRQDRYEKGKSKSKPVVSGSDAHSFLDLERLDGNVAGFEPTWIKCDLTFRGLQQICFEPSLRVYIGSEPFVENRKANQATKFLDKLEIDSIDSYDGSNGSWFSAVNVPLSPELTVIIGNKGSGKSAIVDIIGLLGESRQQKHFSFLSDKGKNKKFKQRGFAENFDANITWKSGSIVSKNLDDEIDFTKPEAVRYIPQNYFEQLTNEIEIEEFRKEIEDVVFSHVEETERMALQTFSELQEFKTQQSIHKTSELESKLKILNIEILDCEEQVDPQYRQSLDEELKLKRIELESLVTAKPKKEVKPDEKDEGQRRLSLTIKTLTEKKEIVANKGKSTTERISWKKNRVQKLTSLLQSVKSLESQNIENKNQLRPLCEELDLDIETILNIQVNTSSIEDVLTTVKGEVSSLERENEIQMTEDFQFNTLVTIPDLRNAYQFLNLRIEELKKQLGTPQRRYQAYLEKLQVWENRRSEIVGAETDARVGSIRYLEQEISYIDNDLKNELESKLILRKEIVQKIFDSKEQVLDFYSDLKKSVEESLSAVRTDGFSVDIDASFILERHFSKTFLNHINKTKRGAFHGSNEPIKVLESLINNVDWNDITSIHEFHTKIIKMLTDYEGKLNSIKSQVNDSKEFYDYLFSLGYMSAKYELRLAGKNLDELSPGEKGLLLLVFYLQLDNDNIPLIIDQPEDNLDNESIFEVLANCIRDAKENRQVILVTHNPNLAIGADAEQVIFVKLEKSDNYCFSYETGAIENPQINQRIIDVLEGTQPAFIKRRLKYQI